MVSKIVPCSVLYPLYSLGSLHSLKNNAVTTVLCAGTTDLARFTDMEELTIKQERNYRLLLHFPPPKNES